MVRERFTPDQWRRVDAVLDQVMDLPPAAREARIDALCAGDAQLAHDVRDFLAEIDRSNGYLDRPAGEAAAGLISDEAPRWDPEARLGQRLGPYEITGILGEGGMGVVYAAHRVDGQYDADVAIKLMLAIDADNPLKKRFLAERQILARLDLPAVARLFDGGLDEDGHPFIVMERVEGRNLLDYADAQGLELEARLDLFAEVCGVVDAAHRSLVLHCDLKPSNILVTAAGDLKLLDFGVARWLDPNAEGPRADAGARHKLFTPGYASPEQLRGEPLTTASDVYALGVLLRDLVTGPHPWARRLRGDMGNIIRKATSVTAADRYGTAHELAEDLRRFRSRVPVEATPATPWYRFRRLLDRNRGATVGLFLVALLVAGGVGSTLWQARIADRERDLARLEAAQAEAVTDFLTGIFEISSPVENKGADVTAREVLDQGAARIAELDDQPALQARLQYVMANVYNKLGEFQTGAELYAASLEHAVDLYGLESHETTDTRLALGITLTELGRYDEAEAQLTACLGVRRTQESDDPAFLTMPIRSLARLHTDRREYQAAVDLFAEARRLDPLETTVDITDLGRYHNNNAVALSGIGRHAAADSAFALAEAAYRRTLDADHPYFGTLWSNWALVLARLDDLEKAEGLHRRALELRRRLKHNRVDTGVSLINLSNLLISTGRPEEAVPLLDEAVEIQREAFGDEHLYVAAAVINLGNANLGMGDTETAARLFAEGQQILEAVFGEDNPAVAVALLRRGQAAHQAGDLETAESFLSRSLEVHRPHLPNNRSSFAEALLERGLVLEEMGQPEAALPLLEEAAGIFGETVSPNHPQAVQTRQRLEALRR